MFIASERLRNANPVRGSMCPWEHRYISLLAE